MTRNDDGMNGIGSKRESSKSGIRRRSGRGGSTSERDDNRFRKRLIIQNKTRNDKKSKSLNIPRAIVTIILLCICGVIGWNFYDSGKYEDDPSKTFDWDSSNETLRFTNDYLTSYVCHHKEGFCHPNLQAIPTLRTHFARKSIPKDSVVLRLPQSLLITDLDALRNEYVKQHLFGKGKSRVTLDSGAYMAAYLCLLCDSVVKRPDTDFQPFCEILPTYEELRRHHPVLNVTGQEWWILERAPTTIGQLVRSYRDMIQLEYQTFRERHEPFSKQASYQQYSRMRIHVMSRSFGMGPPNYVDNDQSEEKLELEWYNEYLNVNLTLGCRAMSPILDMWNHHHSQYNVEWAYISQRHSFVVKAKEEILPSQEIVVSYGNYSDSHLLAKFGFTTTPFITEINLAVFHDILQGDIGLGNQYFLRDPLTPTVYSEQSKNLLKYFLNDDGYAACVRKDLYPLSFDFKRLKFRYLQQNLANDRKSWVFTLKGKNIRAKKVLRTCRLISLTEQDYGGEAKQLLERIFSDNSSDSKLEKLLNGSNDDMLEFRALHCLSRLASQALLPYHESFDSGDGDVVANSDINKVLRNEMETLKRLKLVVLNQAANIEKHIKSKKLPINAVMPNMFVRRNTCPLALSWSLLKEFAEK